MRPLGFGHLHRLTRAVPRAGPGARAIAVYGIPPADAHGEPTVARAAHERGFEGVACVDDAARAIVLYCALWRRRRTPLARVAATGLLAFLAHMQDQDGRFSNFILDWPGRRNRAGPTSCPGGAPWQARAMHALACAVSTFGHAESAERFQLGLRWLDAPTPYLDVRAVSVLAALEYWRGTGSAAAADRALAWSRQIAAHAVDGVLPDAAGVQPIHLWGHLQESALAETGQALRQPDLVEVARTSAEALLLPAVATSFDFPRVLPFDVSCAVAGLAAVARATSDARYASAAANGRQWFHGRNSARRPVYNRRWGLVYDGIDNGHVSRNSGAESTIEGALALLD